MTQTVKGTLSKTLESDDVGNSTMDSNPTPRSLTRRLATNYVIPNVTPTQLCMLLHRVSLCVTSEQLELNTKSLNKYC